MFVAHFLFCETSVAWGFYVICFFFKQKTAYELRISDWSSDVCSSDLWATEVVDADAIALLAHFLHIILVGIDHLGRPFVPDVPAILAIGRVAQEIGRASCRARVCPYV